MLISQLQKTTDCIFIFPPCSESPDSSFNYHLGSAYIISYLNTQGVDARQYIHRDPVNLKTCIAEILGLKPRVAGFTVYDSNYSVAALIAGEIRKSSPQTSIVFGGPCPSVHYGFIMNSCAFVDACFINEAEENFLEFMKQLSSEDFNFDKTDFSGIQGITYRQSGKIFGNHENRTLRNHSISSYYLDSYPSPYLGEIIPATEAHNTGIITARGCNQNCIYCNCAVLSNRRISAHSVDRVISEIEYISPHQKGNQILTFQDDTFTLITKRAAEICNAIIRQHIKVRLACITRCDCIDEALLDLMKEAGFVSLTFSLESVNPITLRRIGKVRPAEEILSDNLEKEEKFIENFDRMAAYAKKIGFQNIVTSIMVGLPGETLSEANRTVEFVENNKNIDQYAHNFLKIFRGTPIYSNYEKYGYKIRYINGNPIFLKMNYPVDVIRKVYISPKSHLHSKKKENDKSTLSILSLSVKDIKSAGFTSIILQSDHVSEKLVNWLKDVLSINGIIIQIYSGEKPMKRLSDRNYEKLTRYSSPSLNIRNYFLKEIKDASLLLSSESVLLKSCEEDDNIKICSFEYFRSRLDEPEANFLKTFCRETDYNDSVSACSFLRDTGMEKDPLTFLTRKKILPNFASLCKWTRENANCVNRSTLIINDRSEVRFCWQGNVSGLVGQPYRELISSLESEMNNAKTRRKCDMCKEESNCVKCPFPFPLPEMEYCTAKRISNVGQTAELIYALDQVKQFFC